MDLISLAINGMNNNILTSISILWDNAVIFSFLTLFLIFFLEKNDNKRKKLFLAVILAFLIGQVIKDVYKLERPCDELVLKTDCPLGYSFPSLHTIIAFTLAIGFLDNKNYLWVLIFALFTAFTRIYLGVHTFEDIAGSVVLSPIIYGFVDYYWRKKI